MASGNLYVIPCFIHEDHADILLPSYLEILSTIRLFIVENTRSARRFIKAVLPNFDIDACVFWEIDKHDQHQNFDEAWTWISKGHPVGLLSEAGSPGIADPGSKIAAEAHRRNVLVKPWIGPTSITLALMGSGLNGQSFTFHGYLPSRNKDELVKKIKSLDQQAWSTGYSQICIETPYRNTNLLQTLIQNLKDATMLVVAADLTAASESIIAKSIEDWKKMSFTDFQKRPAIFIFNRPGFIE